MSNTCHDSKEGWRSLFIYLCLFLNAEVKKVLEEH